MFSWSCELVHYLKLAWFTSTFRYFSYLGFQFYTHSHLFLDVMDSDTDSQHGTWGGSSSSSGVNSSSSSFVTTTRSRRSSAAPTSNTIISRSVLDLEQAVPPLHPLAPVASSLDADSQSSIHIIHHPLINRASAIALLIAITAIMYPTAENLVDSLTALTDANPNGLSKEFLAVIVLPILSNGAELSTAVYAGFKGNFNLVLSVSIGSCIQITLFVIPLLVCVAWGMGKPLSLLFDPLETTVRRHSECQETMFICPSVFLLDRPIGQVCHRGWTYALAQWSNTRLSVDLSH